MKGLGLGLALVLGVAGCSGDQGSGEEAGESALTDENSPRPAVVATTSVICDLTEQIAAQSIALTCLLEPGTDPHTYQVKPSDRQAIEQADLILYDGYGFAPTLISLIQDSTTPAPQVAVYEEAVPEPLMGAAHDHDHAGAGEATDHAHDDGDGHAHDDGDGHAHDDGDGHAEAELVPDPHIWHSAANNAAIATVVADQLTQLNPAQADLYTENADRLGAQFDEIERWIQAQVATVPADQRQLITTHDAFGYFAAAYGLEVSGALSGLSTDEKPTPATLTARVDQIKSAQVPAIFAETTTNAQLIETVAKNAGVSVAEQPLWVEGPGGPGTPAATTQAMLVANTCAVVDALGGMCLRDSAPL
ncbi:MAG: metal ABC transporter substrate-binding protein [Cyanobacteria bacterium J06638_6]